MFLPNRYTNLYYKIVESAKHNIKEVNDGNQTHHIIPRCMGGSDDPSNLVVLSYKQHRVCHRLLIEMTTGKTKYKMMYAYKLFNSKQIVPCPHHLGYYTEESARKMVRTRKRNGTYKTGSENVFASPEVIALVKARMKRNNPMKDPKQRERMRTVNNNPNSKPVIVEGVSYPTLASAARAYNTTPHLLKRDYSVTR